MKLNEIWEKFYVKYSWILNIFLLLSECSFKAIIAGIVITMFANSGTGSFVNAIIGFLAMIYVVRPILLKMQDVVE